MSELPAHRPDVEDEAVGVLTSYLRQGHLLALARIVGAGAQQVEDLVWATLEQRIVGEAVGFQLDLYGRIIGQPRDGLTDDLYRNFLRARILSSRSEGEAERVLEVLRLITGASEVAMWAQYPAGVSAQYRTGTLLPAAVKARVRLALEEVVAAGVSVNALVEYGSEPFGFDGDPTAYGFGVGTLGGTL